MQPLFHIASLSTPFYLVNQIALQFEMEPFFFMKIFQSDTSPKHSQAPEVGRCFNL